MIALIQLRSSFNRFIWVLDADFEALQSVTTEQKLVTGVNIGSQLFSWRTVQVGLRRPLPSRPSNVFQSRRCEKA